VISDVEEVHHNNVSIDAVPTSDDVWNQLQSQQVGAKDPREED
jgi:hypothetical protein